MIKYLLLVIGVCGVVAAEQPNVVIIYADDLNPSGIGCSGGKVLTPNIDKLAAEGVRFTRYYATSAVCSPSRYSLLTGRYASRCKALQDDYPSDDVALIRWNCRLEGKEQTIAHLLGKAGYTSALVGKHAKKMEEMRSTLKKMARDFPHVFGEFGRSER